VEIETNGALLQGVWGNGRIDTGLLNVQIHSPQDVLTPDRLDVSLRGSVVLGGYCASAEVFTAAAEIPLRGLILASMDATLLPVAAKMHYPIIIIEGFGQISMNSVAYRLLSTNERREVVLNAEGWDRLAGSRPEIVIPLPASSQLPLPTETDSFGPGQQVRILSGPHLSKTGAVAALHPGMVAFPSGVKAPAAEVRLESGENAVIPLANLEVLE